jgi:prophage antirepressor-like protein
MAKKKQERPVVYQAKSGAIELRGDVSHETIWATQAQIVEVFDIERSVVTKHIGNVLKTKEVHEKSNVQKMHIANSDKPVTFYSLDMILAVGYRTNSAKAMEFRKWATKTLKEYISKGYVVDRKRIAANYIEFQKAIDEIKLLLPTGTPIDYSNVLELVSVFSDTWLSLDAYDKDTLTMKGATKKSVKLTAKELTDALVMFKEELIRKGEATQLFGADRGMGGVEGIIGNVMQSFGGQDVYATLEEKAANLLYFVIKNHPFSDGNKRSGAYAFIWFLRKVKLLDTSKMTPTALTAITLFIAESNPKNKDRMIRLVLQLLNR